MNLELLIKVNGGGDWLDGDVIDVRLPGVLLSPAALRAWFQDGTVPPGLSSIPRYRRQQFVRRLKEMAQVQAATSSQLAALLDVDEPSAIAIKEANAVEVQVVRNVGLDTNWGWGELHSHLAVTVSGLDISHLHELTTPQLDEENWRAMPTAKRSYRLVQWRTPLTLAEVSAAEDPRVLVPCRRVASYDLNALLFA